MKDFIKSRLTRIIVGTIVIIGFYAYNKLSFYKPMQGESIELHKKDSSSTLQVNLTRSGCYEVGLSSKENIFADLKLDGLYKIEFFDINNNLLKEITTNKGTGISAVYSHTDYSNTPLYIFKVPIKGKHRLKIKLTVLKPESAFVKDSSLSSYIYVNPSIMQCVETEMSRFKKMNLIQMNEKQEKAEYEEIVQAIKEKDLEKFKELVPSKYDVNTKMLVDRTPLQYAIYYKADKIINYLVKNKATLDYIDKQRKTPLYYAIKNNSIDIVDMLLQRGVDPNNTRFVWEHHYKATFSNPTKDELKGNPALYETVCNEQFEITELLLKSPKVDVNEYLRTTNIYEDLRYCLKDKHGKDYTDDFEIDYYGTKKYKNIPKSMEKTIKLLERYGATYGYANDRKNYKKDKE